MTIKSSHHIFTYWPLGRFSLKVVMSVCLCNFLSVPSATEGNWGTSRLKGRPILERILYNISFLTNIYEIWKLTLSIKSHLPEICCCTVRRKLDGVGPVDNRPSTNKLHHFVKKLKIKKLWHVTHDMWHVISDTWHVTCDTWHMTHDMRHVVGGEHSPKISAP